jgi:putative transcriptional regulator
MLSVDSLRGKLLVAAPTLLDPNFFRTVVLLIEHSEEGAMGLVLNRRADTELDDAVPDLTDVPGLDDVLHVGGPVQPQTVILVAEFADPDAAAPLVIGEVGVVGADTDLSELPDAITRGRAFAGYAGWGPGQLDAEIDEDAWLVVDPLANDLLADDPDELWRAVLERQGGWHRVVARMPADPSLN